MPKRVVYYGPFNNNKKEDLIKKAKLYLRKNEGNKFYYVLPNGKLLTKYINDMLKDTIGAFDMNLLTFDDIMNNLLERELYTIIGSEVKESIIEKLLIQQYEEGKLVYYKDVFLMEGFIKSVSYIIGEIKRSLITWKEFNKKIPNTPFYSEIGLIYEEYEKFLVKNRLADIEETFFMGLELLRNNDDYFSELDFIVIDDFFDFRPQEIEVLKEIVKYPLDVYINIPYKRGKEFSTVVRTLKLLQKMGFEIEEMDKNDKNDFEIIGEKLFCEDVSLLPKSNRIKGISAANEYLELKRIAQEIKSLYNNGIKLKDMGIVLTNQNKYKKNLFDIFNEEGIPSSLNEEMRLIDVPLIKELLNIIKVKLSKFDKNSIVNRIKNSYFNVYNSTDKDKVEYILYELNYGDIENLKKQCVNTYLYKSLDKIVAETNSIIDNGSPEELIDSLQFVINDYKLNEKILDIYDKTDDYNLFHRDISAFSKLAEVLEKMKKEISIIYNEIDIENFYEIFLRYLEEETIVITPGNKSGVNILTPSTVQGVNYEVLFVVGLVEGNYPVLTENNFFFREENHDIFRDIGLDIKNYYERLDKECLLFVIAVIKCCKLLYLSYPMSSTGDEENIPSMFLDEISSIFEGEKIDEIFIDMDYLIEKDISETTTESEFINHILYKYFEGEELTDYFHMYNSIQSGALKEINSKIQCEVERSKDEFNCYSGNIGTEEIKNDIEKYHKGIKYSITYFETYGKCPFKFLMDQILKLEGMERLMEDFTPLDKGNIFHMVLKKYYQKHKNEIKNHIQGSDIFNVEDTIEEINETIEALLVKNGIKDIDKIWNMRIENMTSSILELVKMDLDRLSNLSCKMIPVEFEVPFGFEDEFSIFINGENISLIGKIDRIDKVLGEEKYVLYDYKTSPYGIKKVSDMFQGTSLQLPVYIMAQGDREIIGGGYIIISKGEVSMELVKEDEKKTFDIKRRGKYVLNDDEWNDLMKSVIITMKEYIKNIFEGNFSVNPKACDVYCSYRDICRYKGK